MNRTVYILLIAVTLFSCVKKETDLANTQEVIFTAGEIYPSTWMKSSENYECLENLSPDYSKIVITGIGDPFYPKIFYLNNKMYTQSIKLPPGTYTVEQFLIMDDMGTASDMTDDEIYMAIPETSSAFSAYADPVIPFNFTVNEFLKNEISIEVICFQPSFYYLFGFNWFAPVEIVIK
jgi:hypothetical protein